MQVIRRTAPPPNPRPLFPVREYTAARRKRGDLVQFGTGEKGDSSYRKLYSKELEMHLGELECITLDFPNKTHCIAKFV
jgi:hypothetical protein